MRMRDAEASDAVPIAGLQTESWRSAYRDILDPAYLAGPVATERLALWTGRFAAPDPQRRVIVAEREAELAGFVCAIGAADAHWGTLVDNLHVRPNAKSGGVGTALLRAAGEWSATAFPGLGLYLWCFEQNEPARRFYERRGGVVVERILEDAPGGGTQPALRFHWPDPVTAMR
jgi:GNAT superfamily N-acetyltransferase